MHNGVVLYESYLFSVQTIFRQRVDMFYFMLYRNSNPSIQYKESLLNLGSVYSITNNK